MEWYLVSSNKKYHLIWHKNSYAIEVTTIYGIEITFYEKIGHNDKLGYLYRR